MMSKVQNKLQVVNVKLKNMVRLYDHLKSALSLWLLCSIVSSCSLFPKPVQPVATNPVEEDVLVKFSEESNLAPATDRDYRRMTRQRMEDESGLNAGAGSLWVMEGQKSYLFAQNKHRKAGDRTQIKLEGSELKKLEMKLANITDLLHELEELRKSSEPNTKLPLADKSTNKNATEDSKRTPADSLTEETSLAKKNEAAIAYDIKDVEVIPSKIIEQLPDGLYRVAGQQILTIQKRPYKVITTGLVRAEDFDDEFISSNKMYETQTDVIHIKKTEKF